MAFLVLRKGISSAQVVMYRDQVGEAAMKQLVGLPQETLVNASGTVGATSKPITFCTQQDVELIIDDLTIVSRITTSLPFLISDASIPKAQRKKTIADIRHKLRVAEDELQHVKMADGVGLDIEKKIIKLECDLRSARSTKLSVGMRLDNRVLDLRTIANHALFRIRSGMCQLFREFLLSKSFIEVHTPLLRSASSPQDYLAFPLDYFGRMNLARLAHIPSVEKTKQSANADKASLATSSLLYLRRLICADFERVFEVGDTFRRWAASTPNHLTEFITLRFEMAIIEHYDELVELMEELFIWILDGVNAQYRRELEAIRAYSSFKDVVYTRPLLRISHLEAVDMLTKAGNTILDPCCDLNNIEIRQIMNLVKKQYGVDLFILDKNPSACTPFYFMPDATDPRQSNFFRVYLRQEVASGGQHIHDPGVMEEQARRGGAHQASIEVHAEGLQYGAPPQAGCGIGLERLMMGLLGMDNIRCTSLFPRTSERMRP